MAQQPPYSDEELSRYFDDPSYRRDRAGDGAHDAPTQRIRPSTSSGSGGAPSDDDPRSATFLGRRVGPAKAQALRWLGAFLLLIVAGALVLTLYIVALATGDIPSVEALENPELDLATVAYTADGEELQRYALQNRSWVDFDSISAHVVNALVATEDRRFYEHWGVDLRGIMAAIATAPVEQDLRGASTISQQLARNLYNTQIGRAVTVERKVKEMITAVRLERRYTKEEIIEMYLNTVEFGSNAFGIEAAARTFYGVPAKELDVLQSAQLVGMLKAITFYNPVRNPENAQQRRNIVLTLMEDQGFVEDGFVAEHADDPVGAAYRSAEIKSSLAPHFAEYVRQWLNDWGEETDHNIYTEGLVVHTTLDSRMQALARQSVERQGAGLQAVVDYEWSRSSRYGGSPRYREVEPYQELTGYEPFEAFWENQMGLVNQFIRETTAFQNMRQLEDVPEREALQRLRADEAFMDSLRALKGRVEAGLVSIDPRTGYVKAWVGGRGFAEDQYDHVALAKRQPGSTFKPFVYTAAIDNGYSPYYTFVDERFEYYDPAIDETWSPQNSSNDYSGQPMTLREGLALSKNTITGQLILRIQPETVAFYARRMGIESDLEAVPSLALGTSNVTLLEMTSAYATLANGGLYQDPTVVTRIEDRRGNVLYEAMPRPQEAVSEETAYTVVDMMREVVYRGTGQRLRWQWGLGDYDLAAKTGTTQNSADGWFIAMHPDLVTGAWVGFNDMRMRFRTPFWGQGAHNALFLVGDFLSNAVESPAFQIDQGARFPDPLEFAQPEETPPATGPGGEPARPQQDTRPDRVDW